MKIKIFLFTVLLVVSALVPQAWGVTLNFTPTITLTALTSSTVRIQLAGLRATGIDSIIVYSSAASDSLTGTRYVFQAAVTKDSTVVVKPRTTYIWSARADSAGTYRTSVPDTVTTYNVQIADPISESIKEDFRLMFKATAWPKTPSYSGAFSISGTGSDSTMVYEVWPITGLLAKAYSGATDSTQIKFMCWAGYSQPTIGGLWLYTKVDSLTITARGTYVRTWSIPAGAKYFYVRQTGQTGNAYATIDSLWMRRVRF